MINDDLFDVFEDTTALAIAPEAPKFEQNINSDDHFTLNNTTHISFYPKDVKYEKLDVEKMYNGTIFKKEYPFELDTFQKLSVAAIDRNENLLISAHTSAGKTVVAEYAIAHCALNNQRCIYTSPIKALSNQKFRELSMLCDSQKLYNAEYFNSLHDGITIESKKGDFDIVSGNNLHMHNSEDNSKNNCDNIDGESSGQNSEFDVYGENVFCNSYASSFPTVISPSVGLMTGDVTINPNASILVMTTEILRNMLYKGNTMLKEVNYVIFDEIHYLKDAERGVVWEEAIILSPSHFRFVFLSATIPNADEFAKWVVSISKVCCHVIGTDKRPTPLEHFLWVRERPYKILYNIPDNQSNTKDDSTFLADSNVGNKTVKRSINGNDSTDKNDKDVYGVNNLSTTANKSNSNINNLNTNNSVDIKYNIEEKNPNKSNNTINNLYNSIDNKYNIEEKNANKSNNTINNLYNSIDNKYNIEEKNANKSNNTINNLYNSIDNKYNIEEKNANKSNTNKNNLYNTINNLDNIEEKNANKSNTSKKNFNNNCNASECDDKFRIQQKMNIVYHKNSTKMVSPEKTTYFDKKVFLSAIKNVSNRKRTEENDVKNLIMHVSSQGLLPCIVFSFSRKECERYALTLQDGFTDDNQKEKITLIFNAAIANLRDEEKNLDLIQSILPMLQRGVGIHHAGLLPIIKEIVEILFQENLLFVLFATETFAIGLNMPAKCVVFTSLKKFDGESKRLVSSGEYIQMSGRAGRRNLDTKGIVFSLMNEYITLKKAVKLFSGQADKLSSAFKLSYNMILNLMRIVDVDPVFLIKRSFFYFQSQNNLEETYYKIEKMKNDVVGILLPRLKEQICSKNDFIILEKIFEEQNLGLNFIRNDCNEKSNNNQFGCIANNLIDIDCIHCTTNNNSNIENKHKNSSNNVLQKKFVEIYKELKTNNQNSHSRNTIFTDEFLSAPINLNLKIIDPLLKQKISKKNIDDLSPYEIQNILKGYGKLRLKRNKIACKFYNKQNCLENDRVVDIFINNDGNFYTIRKCIIRKHSKDTNADAQSAKTNAKPIGVVYFDKCTQFFSVDYENIDAVYDLRVMNLKALNESAKRKVDKLYLDDVIKNYDYLVKFLNKFDEETAIKHEKNSLNSLSKNFDKEFCESSDENNIINKKQKEKAISDVNNTKYSKSRMNITNFDKKNNDNSKSSSITNNKNENNLIDYLDKSNLVNRKNDLVRDPEIEELIYLETVIWLIKTKIIHFLPSNCCFICGKSKFDVDCLQNKCLDESEIADYIQEKDFLKYFSKNINQKINKENHSSRSQKFPQSNNTINNTFSHKKYNDRNIDCYKNNFSSTSSNFHNNDMLYSQRNRNNDNYNISKYQNKFSEGNNNTDTYNMENRDHRKFKNYNQHRDISHDNKNRHSSPNKNIIERRNSHQEDLQTNKYYQILHNLHLEDTFIRIYQDNLNQYINLTNIYHLSECKKMMQVLRRLAYYDKSITIKGRVACEISTADELILTELIFNGKFLKMDIDEAVALLSCLIFHEFDNESTINEKNKQNYNTLTDIIKKLVAVMTECGIEIKETDLLKKYSWEMMDIAMAWVNGKSFIEICSMSKIFEGSIIRAFRRLEELLKQLCAAAREIGNNDLENLLQLVSLKSKEISCLLQVYMSKKYLTI
ncbi:hypothetical protein EDEG_01987 [Edhazardia aedis USNM 41457]|uniref:Uncharacterized protein n=1 Tax=Edhazardia aedis (strain USNM 41457) TaxID=1003232 RepID=J8ZVN3_EDHAE|nr:hypothetical protein EDEG_01987 [Edhazardia aedis USNM 41457]|eukprot:EJW03718.2 hypothetical protein EDEG_01987 [Edhazardia aedis USNM 41457]